MNVNNKELEKYIYQFLGYGNPNSNYWFIGKEEAGEAKDIDARLKAWIKIDSPDIADVHAFHTEFAIQKGSPKCFDYLFNGNKTKPQKTWAGLIKLQAAIEKGCLSSLDELRMTQSDELGRTSSNNTLLELFPLPAPDHNKHNYQQQSNLDYLKTKEAYKAAVVNIRICTIY